METEHGHSQASAQGSLDPTPPGQCSPGSTGDAWLQGVGQEETAGRPSQPCGGLSTTVGKAGEKEFPGVWGLASSSTGGFLPLFLQDLCCQAASIEPEHKLGTGDSSVL